MRDGPLKDFVGRLRKYGAEAFGKHYGWYRGIVTSNLDPEKRGRILATCPSVTGRPTEAMNAWMLPSGMYAGQDMGQFFPPEIGSLVFVVFEDGDPRFPLYFGGYWTKETGNNVLYGDMKDAAPYPTVRGIVTKYGHKILFVDQDTFALDADGNVVPLEEPTVLDPRIEIQTKYGHKIRLTDEYTDESTGSQKIEFETGGGHKFTMDDTTDAQKIEAVTLAGHKILLDDTVDGHKAEVQTVKGHQVLLDDQDEKVEITDGVNGNVQTMDSAGFKITDANGNTFEMASDGVKINGHHLTTHDFLDWMVANQAALVLGNMGAPGSIWPEALPDFTTGNSTPDSFKTDK